MILEGDTHSAMLTFPLKLSNLYHDVDDVSFPPCRSACNIRDACRLTEAEDMLSPRYRLRLFALEVSTYERGHQRIIPQPGTYSPTPG